MTPCTNLLFDTFLKFVASYPAAFAVQYIVNKMLCESPGTQLGRMSLRLAVDSGK